MIQLVGHELYRSTESPMIDAAAASEAIPAAQRRLGRLVHGPALSDLSEIDRSFLVAMAYDEGPSRMADVAARLGVDANYAGQYRLRLLSAGMIRTAGDGLIAFELPYLGDYLREHATLSLPDRSQLDHPGATVVRRTACETPRVLSSLSGSARGSAGMTMSGSMTPRGGDGAAQISTGRARTVGRFVAAIPPDPEGPQTRGHGSKRSSIRRGITTNAPVSSRTSARAAGSRLPRSARCSP